MINEADLRDAYEHLADNAPRRHALALTPATRTHRHAVRRPVLVAVVAGAAAVTTAAVIASVAGNEHHAAPATGGATTTIVCAPPSGSHPSSAQLDATLGILRQRLRLQTANGSVQRYGEQLVVTDRDRASLDVLSLCGQNAVTIRPLIIAPVSVTAAGGADPLSSVPFPVPTTEAQYAALSPAQRDRIVGVLAHGCVSTPAGAAVSPSGSIVACGPPSWATLLGPELVDNADVLSATATPPSTGSTTWSVTITFRVGALARLDSYRQAHPANGADPSACRPTSTPCAGILATSLDGVILGYTPTNTSLSQLVITGDMSQSAATLLADRLRGPALPLPLTESQASTH